MIPFNIPIKNRNRVGGVMTPPYEQYAKLQFFYLIPQQGIVSFFAHSRRFSVVK